MPRGLHDGVFVNAGDVLVFALLCAAIAAPALGFQAPAPKASATLELVAGRPEAIVHITNHSPAALEAWRFVLSYELAPGSHSRLDLSTETLFDEAPPGTRGRGPIPSGETRDERVTLVGAPVAARVALTAAVFGDSSVEGDPTAILAQRDQYATALAPLTKALVAASARGTPEAKAGLAQVLADQRAQQNNPSSLVVSAHMSIAELLDVDDAQFPEWLAALKRRFDEQRQRALRHRIR